MEQAKVVLHNLLLHVLSIVFHTKLDGTFVIFAALKAFGLAAIMCKTGILIPVDSCVANEIRPRVDFFDSVLVDIGDSQYVMARQAILMQS